ncbi:O-antigen ligase family protein [Ruicaihuangia caeni]|uniref:O-antigen ligase family protein n=1 Tax=Ruicaihuangia caeni TaxID=3042517 RepID=UPI00338F44AA
MSERADAAHVAPRPVEPVRLADGRGIRLPPLHDGRVMLGAALLFTGVGGPALRNALGWWAWGAIVIAGLLTAIVWLVRERCRVPWGAVPYSLRLWLILAALSLIWSHYRLETLLGLSLLVAAVVAAMPLATLLTRSQMLDALALMSRWLLGLSIVFELVVAWFIRHPIGPAWMDKSPDDLLKLEMWSRNVLFVDGKIQGVLGNSTMLGTAAAIALIAFGLQWWRDRHVRVWHGAWALLALTIVALTRSAGVIVALLATAAALVLALATRRTSTRRARGILTLVMLGAAGIVVAVIAFFTEPVLELFGKDSTLTGRTGIWETVVGLAAQHPVVGWGWTGYWMPWTEPFDGLVVVNGVEQLHAHNAWLDVWLQLGFIGVLAFAMLVARVFMRAWLAATSRPRRSLTDPRPFKPETLLPLLVVVFLVVQSVSESHLLVEGWWVVFAMLAIGLSAREFRDPELR